MTRLRITTPPRRLGAGLAAACGLAVLGAACGASSPSTSPPAAASTVRSTATRKALAAKYLAIAEPANDSLETENDGYGDAEHDNLAQAHRDLLAEVATEARFDARLLAIRFPAVVEEQVRVLVSANERRIQLTQRQAGAATLAGLRAFDGQHKASDNAVEVPVREIRRLLALPPPSTS